MSAQDGIRAELLETIRAFKDGQRSFDEVQSKFQTTLALLERTPTSTQLSYALRAAEADLEEIRFLVADEERPSAVIPVLSSLQDAITALEEP